MDLMILVGHRRMRHALKLVFRYRASRKLGLLAVEAKTKLFHVMYLQ